MNQLQTFMADANAQSQDVIQEMIELGGKQYFGTFGDAQMLPDMERTGYKDQLVTPFRATRTQFAAEPEAHQTLTRVSTGKEYFVQMVDTSQPVLYAFLLTVREA